MGRLFLLALVCVIGYSIWNVFSGGDEPTFPDLGETVNEPRVDNPSDTVVERDKEEKAGEVRVLPDRLFVSGSARDFLFIHDWGICREGDWLPCGRILKRWSDKLAVVFDGQKEVVLRFARVVEFPQVVADTASSRVSREGSDRSAVAGGGGSSGVSASGGVGSVVKSFFGGDE